ncbi:MAG TPA: vitamin K epoxide reductase family protein [Tepidisphaeraceae bacterium]|nr:vitamin K epoxide reductase family protein [Tepidisphaeraceae bacterium]
MHPEVQQEHPGKCPKCGMDLVPKEQVEHGRGEAPAGDDHNEMIRQMRRPWLWTNFTVMALGLWLTSSPATFGYGSVAMTWSDVASGVLLVLLSAYSLKPTPRNDFWGRWLACGVGVWLQFAPLVFWAPSAAAYINDTLVGVFVIALTILVPMMPGMAHHMAMMKPGPEVPPGWTYNPSSWHQRAPLIALAIVGWFISRYLAAVQLGYIPAAWEPFFGEGTSRVLHSEVSRMWPISDAGLGAFAYTFEALMGFMGNTKRWRTMPWMVSFFFVLVVPLGLTHIVLVILQPVAVGYWCTLCLAAAFVMLLMIPLMLDEVFAMLQFMMQAKREGKPLWRTFWVGDTIEGGGPDQRTPRYGAPALSMAPAMVWGVSVPWTLLISAALGIWMMFAPAVFGTLDSDTTRTFTLADSSQLAGALIAVVAICAMAEVVRTARYLNVLLGLWLIGSPFMLSGANAGGTINGVIVGLLIAALSLPRGRVQERYASWDRWVI